MTTEVSDWVYNFLHKTSKMFFYQNEHECYKTGDTDVPEIIKDQNNKVVLDMCRKCKRIDEELSKKCDDETTRSY